MSANETINWVPVAGGFLAIGHRPKKTDFKKLRDEGATAVLTLLSENEGARDLGGIAIREGLKWIWLPLANGSPPPVDRDEDIRAAFVEARTALEAGGRLLIHCSAGIHRTGMIAFGLLRFLGLETAEATAKLALLREVTAEGVGEERLTWGHGFVQRIGEAHADHKPIDENHPSPADA